MLDPNTHLDLGAAKNECSTFKKHFSDVVWVFCCRKYIAYARRFVFPRLSEAACSLLQVLTDVL